MLKKTIAKIFYWIGFLLLVLAFISSIDWYFASVDEESRTNLITTLSSFFLAISSLIFGFVKSTEPMRDYKRQLQNINQEMRKFNTRSALTFLEDTVMAIELNENLSKDQISELLGEYKYTEAQCRADLGGGEEVLEIFIAAYKLNPNSLIIKSRACTSYFALGKIEKSKKLAESLLSSDEFNNRGLAIKCLIGEEGFNNLPSYVQKDPGFLNVYLNFLYNDGAKTKINSIIERVGNVLPENITYDNIRYWCFRTLFSVEHTSFVDLSLVKIPREIPNREELEWQSNLCTLILAELKDTHVLSTNRYFQQFEIISHFLEYTLHENVDSVILLYDSFKENPEKISRGSFIQLITNLSQVEEYDKIIELCSNQNLKKDNDLEFVIGHTYVLKGDTDSSINHFTKYLEKASFNKNDIGNLRVIARVFKNKNIDPVEQYDILLSPKQFDSESSKILCKTCFYSTDLSMREQCYKELDNLIAAENNKFDDYIKVNIAILFYELGYHNENVRFMSSFIDKTVESHGFYLYIKSLYLSESNHEELVNLLKHWRDQKFSPVPLFYWYEITIYLELGNHEFVQEVSKRALNIFGIQGDFLFARIYSLYRLKRFDDLKVYLNEGLTKIQFTWNQIANIADICFNQNLILLGLELMYPMVNNSSNRFVKMQYFHLAASKINDSKIEALETVEPPCVVRINIENEDGFKEIEIKEEEHLRDAFYEPLVGKTVGDTVTLNAKQEDINVSIFQILNKHQVLQQKITKEFHDSLESKAYGVKTIDGGKNGDELIYQIIDAIGDDGYKRKVSIENSFDLYRQSKLSLGNLIRRVNINKAFQIIEQLQLDNLNGFNSPPKPLFQSQLFDSKAEFIVDISSLFGVIRLHESGLLPKADFLVSQNLIDYLDQVLNEESNPNTKGYISATFESVNTHIISEDERNFNVEKIQKVIRWIDNHCKIGYSYRKLDLLVREQNNFEISDWHQQYLMDNLILASEPNRFLISDDSFYYETAFGKVRMLSLETFMEEFIQDKEDRISIVLTLIELNYNGLTLDCDILNRIFDKGVILESSSNLFNRVLNCLPYYRHQDPNVLFEVIKHTKYIYSHNIGTDSKKKLCQSLFTETFKSYPIKESLTGKITNLVKEEFDLLGDANLNVLDDINVSLNILGLSIV